MSENQNPAAQKAQPAQAPHWGDKVVDKLIAERGRGPFLIASGISPSGRIHVGNLREVLTADIVYRILKERGCEAKLIFVADDYDALRKVYPFLDPAVYEQYVGCPLSEIPAPDGNPGTYAEFFLKPFVKSLAKLKIDAEVVRASELYRNGTLKKQIVAALNSRDQIAEILTRITGKEIDADWSPFTPHCRLCGNMKTTKLTGWNPETEEITYYCSKCDCERTVPVVGNGKLTWRADWPARWAALGVDVEPMGKDHGGKGGSYDSGKEIVADVYGGKAPFPIIYEWIRLAGLGDMSSSKGNVVSVDEVLEVVPPDVLRYFITRPAPKASLALDLVTQLLNLVDEVDDETKKQRDRRSVELSQAGGFVPLHIPFNHLVNVWQVAGGDFEKVKKILVRTGFPIVDEEALKERCHYADEWLKRYATPDFIFTLLDETPAEIAAQITDDEKAALEKVAAGLEANPEADGNAIHQIIYGIANDGPVPMGALCKALYRVTLGRDRGPRAGWFVAMAGTDVIAARLRKFLGR